VEVILDSYYFQVFIKLLAAMLLGGIVGFERAESHQAAGLRTHILVCVGSAAVMIAGSYAVDQLGATTDITRMGAQVISGIGFLGAGTIITTSGDKIKGLTTAAGLWVTACMGILAGLGAYWAAFMTVMIVIIAVFALRPFAKKMENKRRYVILRLELNEQLELPIIYAAMESAGLQPDSILEIDSDINNCNIHIALQSHVMPAFNYNALLNNLGQLSSITHIHCEFRGMIIPS